MNQSIHEKISAVLSVRSKKVGKDRIETEEMGQHQNKSYRPQQPRYGMAFLLVSSLTSGCEAFVQQPQPLALMSTRLQTAAPPLPDLSEVLNGESCVDPSAKEFIESSSELPLAVNGNSEVSSFAPPLTYEKYLTMQVSVSLPPSALILLFPLAVRSKGIC